MTFTEICRAVWKEQKHIDDEDAKKTRTKYIFTEFDMNFFYKKKEKRHILKCSADIAWKYCSLQNWSWI